MEVRTRYPLAALLLFWLQLLATNHVASYTIEDWGGFISSQYIGHWLRVVTPPDPADCKAAGDKLADPSDCKNFYFCTGYGEMITDPITCPDEFNCFDPAYHECMHGEDACAKVCDKSCQYECNAFGDYIADAEDCNKNYLCVGDGPPFNQVALTCPTDTPYFDGFECVTDQASCCNCQIESCTEEGELLADPQDCHAYYACVMISGDIMQIPVDCTNGTSFINGACDDATPDCDNACDLSGTTPGGNATNAETTPSIGKQLRPDGNATTAVPATTALTTSAP